MTGGALWSDRCDGTGDTTGHPLREQKTPSSLHVLCRTHLCFVPGPHPPALLLGFLLGSGGSRVSTHHRVTRASSAPDPALGSDRPPLAREPTPQARPRTHRPREALVRVPPRSWTPPHPTCRGPSVRPAPPLSLLICISLSLCSSVFLLQQWCYHFSAPSVDVYTSPCEPCLAGPHPPLHAAEMWACGCSVHQLNLPAPPFPAPMEGP